MASVAVAVCRDHDPSERQHAPDPKLSSTEGGGDELLQL